MGRVVGSVVREHSSNQVIGGFHDRIARDAALGRTVPGRSMQGSVSRSLPSNLTAVRQARDVVQRVLQTWHADEIFDDVVLVASELVANALRHGLRVDEPRPGATGSERDGQAAEMPIPTQVGARDEVQISLMSTGSHVICAVTDPSQAPPVRRRADPFAGSGRGLELVESLSMCWGWTLLDGDDSELPSMSDRRPAPGEWVQGGSVPSSSAQGGSTQGKSVWAIFPLAMARPARVVGAA